MVDVAGRTRLRVVIRMQSCISVAPKCRLVPRAAVVVELQQPIAGTDLAVEYAGDTSAWPDRIFPH